MLIESTTKIDDMAENIQGLVSFDAIGSIRSPLNRSPPKSIFMINGEKSGVMPIFPEQVVSSKVHAHFSKKPEFRQDKFTSYRKPEILKRPVELSAKPRERTAALSL